MATGLVTELVALPFTVLFGFLLMLPLFWALDLVVRATGLPPDAARGALTTAGGLGVCAVASGVAALVACDLLADDPLPRRAAPLLTGAAQVAAIAAFLLPAGFARAGVTLAGALDAAGLIAVVALGAWGGHRVSSRWNAQGR